MENRTISAISTPFGKGGIAVIRISGMHALDVAKKMFFPASGSDLSQLDGGSAVYGRIKSGGSVIDDGIATVFFAPRSFTGEDVVEISCHGGILLSERVLAETFACGAVQAEAGEFTQRAFLNGNLDLTAAEAVIGLIEAESEEKLRLCASHAQGVLSKRADEIYGRLVRLISSVYVKLDYPEEDLAEVSDGQFLLEMERIHEMLEQTSATYRQGKAVSEGVKTALIGKPNAGKSSLLNLLAGEERAIVTSVPGTTRDVIEEKVSAGRIVLRLFDTAGIRESDDEVEKIGIERARKKADEADMIFAVIDSSSPLDGQDREVIDMANAYAEGGKAVIAIMSKSDVQSAIEEDELRAMLSPSVKVCQVSSVTGQGCKELKNAAEAFFCDGVIDYESTAVVVNARQFSALREAADAVERATAAFKCGMGADICGLDLERAASAIGQIDGRAVSEEITNDIFHRFCVGK